MGHEEPLVLLGKGCQRDILQAQLEHDLQGSRQLALASVDQHQVGDRGPAGIGGSLGLSAVRGAPRGRQTLEAPAKHLAHALEIVHAVDGFYLEAAVLRTL